jgi:glycosyltransferase involved in cell wall biosynthesis
MRILCFNTTLDVGGAARQLSTLACEFKKRGHDITFLIYHDKIYYRDMLEDLDIPIVIIKEDSYFKRLIKIRKFIRSSSFDAVLTFLGPANFISICSGFPFRRWSVIVGERSADPGTLKSIRYKLFRMCHLFATAVVSNSQANMDMVKKVNPFLPLKKRHIIYNTLDLNIWHPNIDYRYKSGGKLKLVVPARYHAAKNLDNFVEAVNLLDEHTKKHLIINWFGNIEAAESSRKIYEDAKNKVDEYGLNEIIKLHLASDNIYEEIINSDVVGLFSIYEGLPNAICEGMACGKPIIATNVSDIKYLIHSDENGIVIENTNPQSISESLSYLIRLDVYKLKIMGEKSREMALKLFSSEDIVDKYLHLLLGGKSI